MARGQSPVPRIRGPVGGGRGPARNQGQTRANVGPRASPDDWGPQGTLGDWGPAGDPDHWEQANEGDWGPADSGDEWGPAATGHGPARASAVRGRTVGLGAAGRAAVGDKRPSWKASSAKVSSAKVGAIIIAAASLLATVLIVIFNVDAGAGARQKSQNAAAMAPVTELGMLASGYSGFAALDNQQLAPALGSYNANENSNLAAARSALQSELATERSFDASLTSWLAVWKSDYPAAKALLANGVADPDEPATINIPYTSSVAKTAQALLTADQAGESVITQQAQAGTLFGMRSFNNAHQAANNAVGAQAALLRRELHLPPA